MLTCICLAFLCCLVITPEFSPMLGRVGWAPGVLGTGDEKSIEVDGWGLWKTNAGEPLTLLSKADRDVVN